MMKKISSYLLAIASMAAVVLSTGCKNDDKPTPDPVLKPEVSLAVKTSTPTSAIIAVTTKNAAKISYTHYLKGERPEEAKIVWKEVAAAANSAVDVSIAELVADKQYTFEAFASNATQSSDKKTIDITSTPVAAAVTLSTIVGGNVMVSFKADFTTECEVFFYAITPKATYTKEQFLADCKPVGMGQVNSAMGETSGSIYKNQKGVIPAPGTQYILAAVGATVDADKNWEAFVGEVVEVEVSTLPLAFDNTGVTMNLVVDGTRTTYGGAAAEITRTIPTTDGFYHGVFKDSEIASKTIDAAVIEWLNATPPNGWGKNYELATICEADKNIYDVAYQLEANTAYTLFTVGFDNTGKLGKVITAKLTTPEAKFESTATVEMTPSPSFTKIDIGLSFKNSCAKAYYLHAPAGEYTADQAKNELLKLSLDEYASYWNSEMTTTSFDYLTANTEYDLFVLPVATDRKLGQIITKKIKTLEIKFDGTSTMTAAVTGVVQNPETYLLEHTVALTYANGAVKCEYGLVYAEAGNTETATELATRMYTNGATLSQSTEATIVRGCEETEVDNKIVFVPLDAQGKRGTPVAVTVTAATAKALKARR